jgi:hypothetical protein
VTGAGCGLALAAALDGPAIIAIQGNLYFLRPMLHWCCIPSVLRQT